MRLLILLLFPFGLLAAPPNIVLIVSDDQGYRDLGCFGSKEILTPQLDRLAKEGMKLTHGRPARHHAARFSPDVTHSATVFTT